MREGGGRKKGRGKGGRKRGGEREREEKEGGREKGEKGERGGIEMKDYMIQSATVTCCTCKHTLLGFRLYTTIINEPRPS